VDAASLEPVENLVELMVEKALEQSAQVMRVRHHDDLERHGGVGAILRY
jgi:hypothetical protein